MKIARRFFIVVAIFIALLVGGMVVWSAANARPAELAVNPYLKSSGTVLFSDEDWLVFQPADQEPSVGFIFYPGGNVEAPAYVPALFRIAEAGYLVVDVPMPLNLAILGASKASKVIEAYPEIDYWVIGGHSLGGAMSARFIDDNPGIMDGLVLWASYPADSNDLADVNIQVISIYGTLDGLATGDKIRTSIPLLPAETIYLPIEGGNHAQFGFYGTQNGDLEATISRDTQQDQIVEAMIEFLASFE